MGNSGRIVGDCRDAAQALADTDTFATGVAILTDAASEIELLREALVQYGDRARMSFAPPHLQPVIDMAFAMRAIS